MQVNECYVKDLEVFLDRDRKDIIIVDNSIVSFAFDLNNGVPINSFYGMEENDTELLFLFSFLEEAFGYDDVRTHIAEAFKLTYLQSSVAETE